MRDDKVDANARSRRTAVLVVVVSVLGFSTYSTVVAPTPCAAYPHDNRVPPPRRSQEERRGAARDRSSSPLESPQSQLALTRRVGGTVLDLLVQLCGGDGGAVVVGMMSQAFPTGEEGKGCLHVARATCRGKFLLCFGVLLFCRVAFFVLFFYARSWVMHGCLRLLVCSYLRRFR